MSDIPKPMDLGEFLDSAMKAAGIKKKLREHVLERCDGSGREVVVNAVGLSGSPIVFLRPETNRVVACLGPGELPEAKNVKRPNLVEA